MILLNGLKSFRVIKIVSIIVLVLSHSLLRSSPPKIGPFLSNGMLESFKEKNKHFVGRHRELHQLKIFHSSGGKVLALVGLPGMGKTTIARQFIIDNYHKYEGILWLEGTQDLRTQLLSFAEQWNSFSQRDKIPSYYLDYFSSQKILEVWLPQRSTKWLVVLDGFNEQKQLRKVLKSYHSVSDKDILITTRTMNHTTEDIKLTKLTRRESIQLLQNYIKKDKETLDELAQILGDYPLALKHAALILKQNPNLNVKKFILLFKEKKSLLDALEKRVAMHEEESDYKITVASIIEFLLKDIGERSLLSHRALHALTFLNEREISLEIIEDWLTEEGEDKDRAHEILFDLTSNFIIEPKENQQGIIKYEMHNLVKTIIHEKIGPHDQKKFIWGWIQVFNKKFNVETSYLRELIDRNSSYYHNAKLILEEIKQNQLNDKNTTEFKIHLMHVGLFYTRDFDFADSLIESIEVEIKNCNDLDNFLVGRFYVTLSNSLYTEDINKAIKASEDAVILLEPFTNIKSKGEVFFALVNNLCNFYLDLGDVSKALSLRETAKSYLSDLTSPVHHLMFYFPSSFSLFHKGDYEASLLEIEEGLKFLTDHKKSDSAYPYFKEMKVELLTRLGRYQESSIIAQEVFEMMEKIFPSMSVHLPLRLRAYMAWNHLGLNDNEQAYTEILKVIEEYNNFIKSPQKNNVQAMSHMILGDIYKAKKQFKDAFKSYQFAESIFENIFTKKEIIDISDLYRKMTICALDLKDEVSVSVYFYKQLETFGAMHSGTLKLIDYFDKRNIPLP